MDVRKSSVFFTFRCMKRVITVVDYSNNWPAQFNELKEVYVRFAGSIVEGIEHVGSTAIPGLAAKPILDIDLIVAGESQLKLLIPVLASIGYQYAGDLGIPDRYAFKAVSNQSPDDGSGRIWPEHHLYCCIANSISLTNHLLFRDMLRKHPELKDEYGALKKKLAGEVVDDIDRYVEGKSPFIAMVLTQAGITSTAIEDIIKQNKKKS